MTKEFIYISPSGKEESIFQHTRKKYVVCDGCLNYIEKGEYYTESDAGEKYCINCSTE